ncbi:MAG: phage tail tube protein [Lawsonibacter sp.]
MATSVTESQILRGNWGELWKNGVKMAEVTAFSAKVSKKKTTVNLCGRMVEGNVVTSVSITGSMTLYKVDSGENADEAAGIIGGTDERYTLITKMKDPGSSGGERWRYTGVSFDEIPIEDWKSASEQTVTRAFTATGLTPLQTIAVE